jgi:hypothetical protein
MNSLKSALVVNWLPTLCGLLLAVLESIQAVESGDPKDWAQAALYAALGYVTRQWNKSSEETNEG